MELTIGANIKRLRTQKGITQEQLAEAMNLSCAAVSKWEHGETFPDITLLQPLAYFFNVSLDELMGYCAEKINRQIEDILDLYLKTLVTDHKKAGEIITSAYQTYPGDARILHHYMWFTAGDMADNDNTTLLSHKEEFLGICNRILDCCNDENIRLGTYNMRAKLLHAEGNTSDALGIYRTMFPDWYGCREQKIEQLYAKGTDDYYTQVRINMLETAVMSANKLGRVLFYTPLLNSKEKRDKAALYGELLIKNFETTQEPYFLIEAYTFLETAENDFLYRNGTAVEDLADIHELLVNAAAHLDKLFQKDNQLEQAYKSRRLIQTTLLSRHSGK